MPLPSTDEQPRQAGCIECPDSQVVAVRALYPDQPCTMVQWSATGCAINDPAGWEAYPQSGQWAWR